MKNAFIFIAVAAAALVLVYLIRQREVNAVVSTETVPPADGAGLKLADGICSLPGVSYVDFTGQCAKLKDPQYRADVSRSYSNVFSSKTPVGSVIKSNFLAVANPLNWGGGPKGSVNWRNGQPLANGGTPVSAAPKPSGTSPPATKLAVWRTT